MCSEAVPWLALVQRQSAQHRVLKFTLCACPCHAGKISIRNMADKKTVEEVDTLVATRSAHEGAVRGHCEGLLLEGTD